MHISPPLLITLATFTAASPAPLARSIASPFSSTILIPPTVTPVIPIQPIVTYLPPAASPESPVTPIFSRDGVGFENLAVRSSAAADGALLATTAFPEALLFYIDIDRQGTGAGVVLHNFTDAGLVNTVGIVEMAGDVFFVAGQKKGDGGGDPVFGVFAVQMRRVAMCDDDDDDETIVTTPPTVREVCEVSGLLNGMTSLHASDRFILSADTMAGGVWRIDIDSGEAKLVIRDASMAGPANKTQFAAFGINGLRARDGVLFYCNSGAQTFWSMPVSRRGTSAGPARLIAAGLSCDDFALDHRGEYAYVASPSNALVRLDLRTGAQLVVAGTFNGSASDIVSASSAVFGVGNEDRESVYVTTNGGAFVGAPPGSQGISRVDLGDWESGVR